MSLQGIVRGVVSIIFLSMGICLYFGRFKQIQEILGHIYNFDVIVNDSTIFHYERTSGFLFLFLAFINSVIFIIPGPVLRLVADFGNFAIAVHLLVESFYFNTYTGTATIIWIVLTVLIMQLASPKKPKLNLSAIDNEELEEMLKTEKKILPTNTKKKIDNIKKT